MTRRKISQHTPAAITVNVNSTLFDCQTWRPPKRNGACCLSRLPSHLQVMAWRRLSPIPSHHSTHYSYFSHSPHSAHATRGRAGGSSRHTGVQGVCGSTSTSVNILTPPGISAKRLACSDGELRIIFVMTQKSGVLQKLWFIVRIMLKGKSRHVSPRQRRCESRSSWRFWAGLVKSRM